ncbi:MAG: phosphatase PAP2 family protein [Halobacteriales archaeon]
MRPEALDVLFEESSVEAVRGTLPDGAVAAFEVATHLGDGVVLGFLAFAFYLAVDGRRRRAGAVVLSGSFCAHALTVSLKGVLKTARPDTAAAAAETGFSTPSGHALGATVVFGLLALHGRRATFRRRLALAGVLAAVVGFSRVAIGVHYPGDVLLGFAVGVVFVWLAHAFARGALDLFGFAFAVGVAGVLVGSPDYVGLTLGATSAAAVTWWFARERLVAARPRRSLVVALALATAVTLSGVATAVPVDDGVAVAIVSAVGAAWILVVPLAAERLDNSL